MKAHAVSAPAPDCAPDHAFDPNLPTNASDSFASAGRHPPSAASDSLPFGKQKPNTDGQNHQRKHVSIKSWESRDAFVRMCVNFGLNGPQISRLSLMTPQPLRTHQQVYEKIEQLHLGRTYRNPKVRRRRSGEHNKDIIDLFIKCYGQAIEKGYEVTEVMRDETPLPGARFRTDFGLRIGTRLFLWEYQTRQSRLEYVRWHEKLLNYERLYERLGEPFRANFVLHDEALIQRVQGVARKLLGKDHPNLNLFQFITKKQYHDAPDVLTEKIWLGTWNGKRIALL